MATRKTPKTPRSTAILSALAAAVLMSGGIFTIPAGNARAAEATCPADAPALPKFKPADPAAAAVATPFRTSDGTPVTVADVAGKRGAVVNFWATWCAPCIKEMPELDALKATLADDGISVITVSQDRGGMDVVKPFFDKHGYKNLAIHLDPKAAFARANKVRGLPTTILYDATGREKGRLEGIAEWNAPGIVDFIRACLPPKSGG
ncbi:MAG: TlpA disulfide reductase family protein [Rhodospirillales bacterium]